MSSEISSGSEVSEVHEAKGEVSSESSSRSEHMDKVEDNVGKETDADPKHRYEINDNGDKEYKDDNGDVYRTNDDLVPNNTYEINGYTYNTDEQGRIASAEGKLKMSDHDRKNIADSKEKIGKGDELETDDRGHLIADMFDGSNGMENMTPQDSNLNRKDVKNLEMELSKAVKDNKDVQLGVYPVYDGDSHRPSGYVYEYSIDGVKNEKFFENE